MDATDLCYLSASELRTQFQNRNLSPVELTRAVLDRIDRLNPDLNAFVTVTPDLALEQAQKAEEAYAEGDAPPLAGIPGSLKDLTVTRGIRTTKGSLLSKDWVPDFDAPIVERLYAAGMVMLGKTNTPAMGWKGDSGNRVVGPTHNPWKHGQTAGGSSGGAAAAVAAGLSAISQGSDGAGSIRIPASFSGVYGLKPSWGLVPYYPASAVAVLSHIGPITRTVQDAALMLNAMAGPDARDPTSLPGNSDFTTFLGDDLSGLRVAWSPDLGYAPIDPEVREIAARAAARFEELGCSIDEAHPDLPDPWDHILSVIWGSAFAGLSRQNLDEIRDSLDPGLLKVTAQGFNITGPQVAEAHMARNDYYQGWRNFMHNYDLILTPTLPVTAFPAGDDHPGQINGHPTTYLGWTAFTYPFNITGQPAATVPCGFAQNGLPVGLQIVGRWRDDAGVIRASAAFEALAPWNGHRPSFHPEGA